MYAQPEMIGVKIVWDLLRHGNASLTSGARSSSAPCDEERDEEYEHYTRSVAVDVLAYRVNQGDGHF